MSLSHRERIDLLSQWIKPSSLDEKDQQDRAERMISDAIKAHPPFRNTSVIVYPKGSYPNNTNVRRDSDVDIVVECQDCQYYDYASGVTPIPGAGGGRYEGPWTPEAWRREVTKALVNCFGSNDVDSSGKVAVLVAAKPGSRPSTDVVPSFDNRLYWSADRRSYAEGSCVFKTDGSKIVNWPQQQFDNGRAKNQATGQRYKNYVRALKNAENTLAKEGLITPKPSYLMECLIWNVDNATLKAGDLDEGFRGTLIDLWQGLDKTDDYEKWVEPNELKYLFRSSQKWKPEDARQLVLQTWGYLGYK